MKFSTLLLVSMAAQAGSAALDWRWDRESAGCDLTQQVNAGGDAVQFGETPGNGAIGVIIKDRVAGKIPSKPLEGGVLRFGDSERFDASIFVSRDGSGVRSLNASTTDPNAAAQRARASTVTVSHPKFGEAGASVRSAEAAANAIDQCPVAWRALKVKPVALTPLWQLLSPYDFPELAVYYRLEGKLIVRLDVSPDGRVSACKSLNKLPHRDFERNVCSAFKKKARFTPAIGADGNVAAAPHVMTINFVLP